MEEELTVELKSQEGDGGDNDGTKEMEVPMMAQTTSRFLA
jgi:hypothetical protein